MFNFLDKNDGAFNISQDYKKFRSRVQKKFKYLRSVYRLSILTSKNEVSMYHGLTTYDDDYGYSIHYT